MIVINNFWTIFWWFFFFAVPQNSGLYSPVFHHYAFDWSFGQFLSRWHPTHWSLALHDQGVQLPVRPETRHRFLVLPNFDWFNWDRIVHHRHFHLHICSSTDTQEGLQFLLDDPSTLRFTIRLQFVTRPGAADGSAAILDLFHHSWHHLHHWQNCHH